MDVHGRLSDGQGCLVYAPRTYGQGGRDAAGLRALMQDRSWTRVYLGQGPTDAYLVRDWLARNGVPSEVRGEGLLSVRGDVPVSEAWPAVWAPPDRAAEAKALIEAMNGPSLVHPPWRCGVCAETNEANFGSCWSCGADAPHLERMIQGGR